MRALLAALLLLGSLRTGACDNGTNATFTATTTTTNTTTTTTTMNTTTTTTTMHATMTTTTNTTTTTLAAEATTTLPAETTTTLAAEDAGDSNATAGEEAQPFELSVRVLGATGLADKDFALRSDPYAVCNLDGVEQFRTQTINGNLNPVWNSGPHEVECADGRELEFRVYDQDPPGAADDLLGTATKPCRELRQGFDGTLALSGPGPGTLRVELVSSLVAGANATATVTTTSTTTTTVPEPTLLPRRPPRPEEPATFLGLEPLVTIIIGAAIAIVFLLCCIVCWFYRRVHDDLDEEDKEQPKDLEEDRRGHLPPKDPRGGARRVSPNEGPASWPLPPRSEDLEASAGVQLGSGARQMKLTGTGGIEQELEDQPVDDGISPRKEGTRLPISHAAYQRWVYNVYQRYNPGKLNNVDKMLDQYRGREAELVELIVKKYRLGHCDRPEPEADRWLMCCMPRDVPGGNQL